MSYQFPEEVRELLETAETYFKDGAFLTAGDRLVKAAAHIYRMADQRNQALTGLTGPVFPALPPVSVGVDLAAGQGPKRSETDG